MRDDSRQSRAITKWDPSYAKRAFALAILGASDKVLATVFGVTILTINNWKQTHPDFLEQYRKGQTEATSNVALALYTRAIGYEYEEEQVHVVRGEVQRIKVKKHVRPDPWSAARYLNLRGREFGWCEAHAPNLTQNNININSFDLTVLSTDELRAMKKLGLKNIERDDTQTDEAQIAEDGRE